MRFVGVFAGQETVKRKKCGIAAFAGLERFSASRAGAVFVVVHRGIQNGLSSGQERRFFGRLPREPLEAGA